MKPTELAAALLGLAAASAALGASPWMLMSRHGECVEVETLKRRVPDLGGVRDPYAFVELMRRAGHQVSSNEISAQRGKAVEVRVPQKDLFLVFVAPAVCENKRN